MVTSTVSSVSVSVVAIPGLGISRPLAVVAVAMAVTMAISVSASVVAIPGLSISRSLAIVAVVSVGVRRSVSVSVSAVSVSVSVVTVSRLGSGGGLGISIGLSISGPLAVVVASVATIITSTVSSIPVSVIAI